MLKFFLLLLLIFLLGPRHSLAIDRENQSDLTRLLDKDTLLEIASIAESLNRLPPDHLLVGVGRSPSPFFEYLKEKYPERDQVQLPLSGMRSKGSLKNQTPFTPDELEILYKHFDRYLGPHLSKENIRSVVLVDYSNSGNTFRALQTIFKKYLDKKNHSPKTDVKIVALTIEDHYPNIGLHSHFATLNINHAHSKLGFHLIMSNLSNYAAIAEFDVNHLTKQKLHNDFSNSNSPKHQELLALIKTFVHQNPNLHLSPMDQLRLKFRNSYLKAATDVCRDLLKTLAPQSI